MSIVIISMLCTRFIIIVNNTPPSSQHMQNTQWMYPCHHDLGFVSVLCREIVMLLALQILLLLLFLLCCDSFQLCFPTLYPYRHTYGAHDSITLSLLFSEWPGVRQMILQFGCFMFLLLLHMSLWYSKIFLITLVSRNVSLSAFRFTYDGHNLRSLGRKY